MGVTSEDYDYDSADENVQEDDQQEDAAFLDENQGAEDDEEDEEDSDYLGEEEEEVGEDQEEEEPDEDAENDDGVEDDDGADEDDDDIANQEEEEEDDSNDEDIDNVNQNIEDEQDYYWWRLPDERGEPPGNMRTFEQISELLEDNDAASKSGDMPQDYLDEDDIDTLVQHPINEKWFTTKKKRNRFEKSRRKNSRQSEPAHRIRSRSPHRKRATKSCL